MERDEYQRAWQAHSSQTRVTVDAESLLEVVQQNQRSFRAIILWRDITEVGVGLLLLPFWIYIGLTGSQPWTWWLGVPAIIFVVGFFLIDRWRHPQTPSDPGEPLLKCVQDSLTQVEHQIWLLRNIFWWYLLPFTIALLAYFGQVSWQIAVETNDWLAALAFGTFLFVFVFAIYSSIYYTNQRAVRTGLEPQRQELLTLLASLKDETTSEVSGDYPILMAAKRFECSSRRLFVAGLCFFAILLIGVSGFLFLGYRADQYLNQEYPKKSPFAAVRWQESQPEIKIGEEWLTLVSLDGIAAEDIVDFSQRTYDDIWQKRFEEDLVEILTRMGHEPKDTVRLVVRPLGSSETRTLEDVPMTEANRQAIYRANSDADQHRERGAQ